jgi:hypothetical protein
MNLIQLDRTKTPKHIDVLTIPNRPVALDMLGISLLDPMVGIYSLDVTENDIKLRICWGKERPTRLMARQSDDYWYWELERVDGPAVATAKSQERMAQYATEWAAEVGWPAEADSLGAHSLHFSGDDQGFAGNKVSDMGREQSGSKERQDALVDITDENFERIVLESTRPFVVVASVPGDSRDEAEGELRKLASAFSNSAHFGRVHLRKQPRLYNTRFNGTSGPQMHLYRDGQVVASTSGYGESVYKEWEERLQAALLAGQENSTGENTRRANDAPAPYRGAERFQQPTPTDDDSSDR